MSETRGATQSKFPALAVKKPVPAKVTAEDTLKRYPRIMAELAK